MRRVKLSCAGFFRATVRKSEQGFCVKAVRKPVGRILPQSVLESLPGARPAGHYIRTVADWSSSQNNNNNAWNQNFSSGNQNNNNKNNTNSVRAVRGFTQKQTEGEALPGPARKRKILGQAPFFGDIGDIYAA